MLLKVEITLNTTFKHMTLLVRALLILIFFLKIFVPYKYVLSKVFPRRPYPVSEIHDKWGIFAISKSLIFLWGFVHWDIFENHQMWKHGVELQNLESLITWRTRRCQNWLQRRSSRTKWGALWALLKWRRGLRWEIPFLNIWQSRFLKKEKNNSTYNDQICKV